MTGSSFMHSVATHKFFCFAEESAFFAMFFLQYVFYFFSSIFCFFFLLLNPRHARSHPVKSYSIFDAGENDLRVIRRFPTFSRSLKRSTQNVNRPAESRSGKWVQIKKAFAYVINCFPLVSAWITSVRSTLLYANTL